MHTWTSQKKIVNGLPLPCFLTVSYPRKSYHCNPSTSTLKDSDPELLPEKGCTSMTFAKGVFMTILTCPPFPPPCPCSNFQSIGSQHHKSPLGHQLGCDPI